MIPGTSRNALIHWYARFRQGDLYRWSAPVTRGKIEMEDWEIPSGFGPPLGCVRRERLRGGAPNLPRGRSARVSAVGERIRGRRNIQASRFAQPSMKRFTVRRILGAADLWVTEFVLTAMRLNRGLHALDGSSG
jgi:hypothetical protein